ncbi:penicillin-binding protein activator LpoB [Treponema sp. TIM-1]|uniref:hypothetical protein n=1 Tax=Treponema sp. TIM-1 TaxID=2898417 RepID=UPI0039816341
MKYKLFIFLFLAIALKVFGSGSQEDEQSNTPGNAGGLPIYLRKIQNEVSTGIQEILNQGDSLAIVAINNTTEDIEKNIIFSIETGIARAGYVKLISRRHISEAISEIELGFSGYIDDDSAVRIGHFLGVTYIMVGDITNNILTLQILEVESLHIVYSERFDVSFFEDSAKSINDSTESTEDSAKSRRFRF